MIAIIIFLIFSVNVSAQYQLEKIIHQEEINDSESLDGNTSSSQKIYDDKTIKQQIPGSMQDILQGSTNATTSRGPRASAEAIQIRGLDSKKVYVLIDGARQNYQEGHSTMIPVDLENLKTVIVKKDTSDFSQSGSLGGGIEFVSKSAIDYLKVGEKVGEEFVSKYFTANRERMINAKGISKNDKLATMVSLTASKSDELKLNNGTHLPNSSFEEYSGLLKINYGHSLFSYEKYYKEDDNPLDPSLNPPNSIQSLQADSKSHKDTLIYSYEREKVKSSVYLNKYLTKKVDRETNKTQRREIQTIGAKLKNSSQHFNYGLEVYQDKLQSKFSGQGLSDYPDASSINSSTFLQKTLNKGQYAITPGLQFSHYYLRSSNSNYAKNDGARLSKKIHLDYEVNSNFDVYSLYTEGFNSPKVGEVYPSGLHSKGDGWLIRDNYFIKNEKLKYETSALKEVGLEFKKSLLQEYDQLSLKLSYYQNDINDYIKIERIDRSVLDPIDGTSQFINIPKVQLKGTEVELGYIMDQIDFGIRYSKVRGYDRTNNLFLEDLPADQIIYDLKFNIESMSLNFGYLGIQSFNQNRINPQTTQRTEATPAYYVHNAFIEKDIGEHFLISVRGNNIGNKNYRRHASFLNESGEDFRLMIKFKINTL